MRDIPVGKPSSLLVTFDDKYQIRDVYFPHVGRENHFQNQQANRQDSFFAEFPETANRLLN